MRRATAQRTHDYWMSYSDLMAGLLLIFILLLISAIVANTKSIEEKQRTLDEAIKENEKLAGELNDAKGQLAELQAQVRELLAVREKIKALLEKEFGDGKVPGVTFDRGTGAVRLGTSVLFDKGSAELSQNGRDRLARVVPLYFNALLSDPKLSANVEQIVFEGHTSSDHLMRREDQGYLFNLDLSQRRAYSAMAFVIEQKHGEQHGASGFLAAIGYSSSRTLCVGEEKPRECTDQERRANHAARIQGLAPPHEAAGASRRLEIRFRLKDEAAMAELDKLFASLKMPEGSTPSQP